MSNIDKMLEITSANQDLFVDLNDKSAETISGGAKEVFTIKNGVNQSIQYNSDGTWFYQKPGTTQKWTAYSGGTITFDKDVRSGFQSQKYNLANGDFYTFRPNKTTTWNPYDIDLYRG